MIARWENTIIAESNNTVVVENNHYFPPDSVNMKYLKKSGNVYHCTWKGDADYYDVKVNGKVNSDSAFIYKTPTKAASEISGHFAFWKGIEITE